MSQSRWDGDGTDERLFQSGVQRRTVVYVGEESTPGVLGRLHGAYSVEIDHAGLQRLVELAAANRTPQSWTVDGDVFLSNRGGMRPLLHHGDLHIRGSLLVDEHAWLICTGDLRVDGIVSDYRPCTIGVGGTLRARRVVTTGSMTCLGSLAVDEVAMAHGEGTLRVDGTLAAPAFLHHGRDIVAGTFDVGCSVDLGDEASIAAARARISADAFDGDGRLCVERCDRLLRCDLRVL